MFKENFFRTNQITFLLLIVCQKTRRMHVLAIYGILFTLYLYGGGYIFYVFESGNAKKTLSPKHEMKMLKLKVAQLLNETSTSLTIEKIFVNMEKAVNSNGVGEPYTWNYYESCFFAGSIITTIGYGHVAPKTINGQVFLIFYCLFGIPLTVVLLRSLGDVITRRVRKTVAAICNRTKKDLVEAVHDPNLENEGKVTYTSTKADLGIKNRTDQEDGKAVGLETRIQFICITVIALMVILFLLIAAIIRSYSEGSWSIFESVYFWFVTLTTIGLGDYVPFEGRQPSTMGMTIIYYTCTFYLIIGLALVTSLIQCISVLMEGRLPKVGIAVESTETTDSDDIKSHVKENKSRKSSELTINRQLLSECSETCSYSSPSSVSPAKVSKDGCSDGFCSHSGVDLLIPPSPLQPSKRPKIPNPAKFDFNQNITKVEQRSSGRRSSIH